MGLPPCYLPYFWEILREFGRKLINGPTPMVFALILGDFAGIWTQIDKWAHPMVFALILGDFAGIWTQIDKWTYPHGICLNFGRFCGILDAN